MHKQLAGQPVTVHLHQPGQAIKTRRMVDMQTVVNIQDIYVQELVLDQFGI